MWYHNTLYIYFKLISNNISNKIEHKRKFQLPNPTTVVNGKWLYYYFKL